MADLRIARNGICAAALVPTDCDGFYDPAALTQVDCGLSTFEFTKAVKTIDARGDENDCAWEDERTEPGDKSGVYTTCRMWDVELLIALGLEKAWLDAEGNICGYQDAGSETFCICSKQAAGCTHNWALMIFGRAWCEGKPHPDFEYVADVFPSITVEPVEETQTFSKNDINEGRSFTVKMNKNPNFVDPWAIMPSGLDNCYGTKPFNCETGDAFNTEVIAKACACGCTSEG